MTKFSAAQQSQLAQIGAFLRENREKQEKSLEDIAIRTYIRPQLLNGIEQGDPDVLPEPIFVQGFIRRYAESLGLRGVELSQQFTVTSIPSTPRPARSAEPESNSTRLLTREVGTTSAVSTPISATADAPPMYTPSDTPSSADTVKDVPAQPAATSAAPPTNDVPLIVDDAVADEDFASKVAAFDHKNLETSDIPLGASIEQKPLEQKPLEQPLGAEPAFSGTTMVPETSSVPNVPVIPDTPAVTSSATPEFNDGLPAEFTTQSSAPVATTTSTPLPTRPVYSPEPVGIEYGNESPNLKPFAIGAVIAAAIVAGLILLVNMLGGGDRTPDVATENDTEQIESVTPESDLPPVPEEPVAQEPPASTQPVYVEAEATSETYVSVNVDGVNVFEGTMQPGDTQLWEGQSEIDVYSGNAGGLTLSANDGDAKVLGDNGQLGQEVFTAP